MKVASGATFDFLAEGLPGRVRDFTVKPLSDFTFHFTCEFTVIRGGMVVGKPVESVP